uniref:Uncharacterized protein n=1 Tax=Candidatus Kentrum sp. TUN TaxID=2126343 RepID=A0A450ZJJ9_9GAMM|nr:MAG: hypothetical protein BECKTUN1418F_GA0071002_103512 [Candidatus Kentron sp. TUN]VFK56026.1 MAG: hypothetical protein BECKTUN1418E_GA0071001_103612 [Candidatus Kentron sp. TUN]VFK56684.1 MAG: hypothetical protein BECKTUN1418D_GA0071000_10517 [Candidatus Kentron sp. TUN]
MNANEREYILVSRYELESFFMEASAFSAQTGSTTYVALLLMPRWGGQE